MEQSGIKESDVKKAASEIFGVAPETLTTKTKDRKVVKARRIYCYWLSNDLGISMTKIAELLNISIPTVSRSVRIGEQLVMDHNWKLEQYIKT